MASIKGILIGLTVVWFILYSLFLIGSNMDWYACLMISLIVTPVAILIFFVLGVLGGGQITSSSSSSRKPVHHKMVQNGFSYAGGIIILWSMFFLPVLSYATMDNIQYYYWLLGIFRYNDPKLLIKPPGFRSKYFFTISGALSLCALFIISITINQYSYKDKPIILLILGISSLLTLIGFYIWQLYELTPMLRAVNFPNNRTLLPSVGFYAIMFGGIMTIIGGIQSIFFPSKKAPTALPKETAPEMAEMSLVDLDSRYCLNCGMKVEKSHIYCPNCGAQFGYNNF